MLSDKSLANKLSPESVERMSMPMQRQATREIERVVTQGLVTNTHEQVRALLTNTALQNVGALSSLEEHLNQVAPSGAARYQHIVDAYALGAAHTIARW
ncbi:MAG: hypothetical protein ACYCW7_14200 [Pseudomonadaceae bacterium]